MIPPAGIGLAALLLGRALRARQQGRGGTSRTPPGGGRESAVATALLIVLLGWPLAMTLLSALVDGVWFCLPPLMLLLALMCPYTTSRLLFIPLGWHRATYWLNCCAKLAWSADPTGGATLAAARALLRSSPASTPIAPERIEWLESKLKGARPFRGAATTARALLLHARGDSVGAERMMESLEHFDERATPSLARKLATEFLMMQAASRGDWKRVLRLGEGKQPKNAKAKLLRGLALRLVGRREAPSPFGLWLRAWLTGRPFAVSDFLRRALEHKPRAELASEPIEPPHQVEDPLAKALLFHAQLVRTSARLDSEGLNQLGSTWDEALLHSGLSRHLAERTLALDGPGGELALAELKRQVQGDLAALVLKADCPLSELKGSESLTEASWTARNQLLAEVEERSESLGRRVRETRPLPMADEWREWVELLRSHERLAQLGGDELRRVVFPKVHSNVCALAVWLWNQRGERTVANAMFRWLRDEAKHVGDERAFELQTKNAKLGS